MPIQGGEPRPHRSAELRELDLHFGNLACTKGAQKYVLIIQKARVWLQPNVHCGVNTTTTILS